MGRRKTFTVDTILDQAMAVFRERGYHNTSMQMIADRLGASRTSLYATVGDKDRLFAATLRHYGPSCRMPGLARVARYLSIARGNSTGERRSSSASTARGASRWRGGCRN